MYRLRINFLANRQDASQNDRKNGLLAPLQSSISVLREGIDGVVELFGQLKQFVRVNLKWDRPALEESLQINLLRDRRGEDLTANNGQDIQPTKISIFAKISSNSEKSAQKVPILQKIDAETATVLKAQLDDQTALKDSLKRQMIALEGKILEAETKHFFQSQVAAAKAEAILADRKMLMCFSETSWEGAIGLLEKEIAAKLKNQTVQKITEKILQIDVCLQAGLQAIAGLIFWREELSNWKFQLLYWLIVEQQEYLGSLGQLMRQLRQVNDSTLFEQAIEMIVAQKRNQVQYRQVQRVAIRCQERAELAVQKGDENLAREWLIRKNSLIKMARILSAKLNKQIPLVEELRLKLKEWANNFFDDEETSLGAEVRWQLKELNPQIAEFSLLYSRFLSKLGKKQ